MVRIASSVRCWMCEFWLRNESETTDQWVQVNTTETEVKVGVCKILKESGLDAPRRWTRADSSCSTPVVKKEAKIDGCFRQRPEDLRTGG